MGWQSYAEYSADHNVIRSLLATDFSPPAGVFPKIGMFCGVQKVFPAHAGVFLTFQQLNKAGIFVMSLILPLKANDADGVSLIVLDDPNWNVLKHLVAAHQATAGVPPDHRCEQSELIESALEEAVDEVAKHLLPDTDAEGNPTCWRDLDDDDEEDDQEIIAASEW